MVERMPVLDEASYSGRRGGSGVSTSGINNIPNGVVKIVDAPLVDLLDLGVDEPTHPHPPPPNSSSGANFLHDLLGVGADISSSSPQSG